MPRRDASDPFAALTPYEVRHLIEHLVRAGRREAVHRLLAMEGPQGSGWYDLKQRTGDDRGYERDLAVAWQLADAQFREAPDSSKRTIAIGLQLRYAMITGSLGRVSDRLTPGDLRERLASGEWSMSRARATAARASDATVRARMFAELAGVGEDGDVREVLADALSDPSRPVVLAAVSQRLAPETLPAVPEAARALGEEALAEALVAVAPRMPATDVEPWLREAMRLKRHDALARALVALAPRAPAASADDVVLESGLLDDEQAALGLLEALAPGLSPVAAERALEAIRRLPPSARRASVAVVLLEAVPPDRRGGALEAERRAAGRIRARDQRAAALAELGAGAQALEVAAEIHPAERGATITAIAPRLAAALAPKAIQLVSELPSPTVRG